MGAADQFAFTARERRIIRRLRTPSLVQRYLNNLPYNTEPPPGRATLRSFRGVVGHHTAHCLEAALAAAVILEQHGYPPLVLSFESIDGRKAVFASPRALALSYVDPYIDFTGRITGYAVIDLRVMGDYDWRLSDRNVWKVERMLLNAPHRAIRSSDERIDRLRRRYCAFRTQHGDRKPLFYNRRGRWTPLPKGPW